MNFLQVLIQRLEALVYDGLCGLSSLFPPDGNDGGRSDVLASPDPGAPRRRLRGAP